MSIFFAIVAGLLCLMVIGEKDDARRAHFTYAFMAAVAGALVTYALR